MSDEGYVLSESASDQLINVVGPDGSIGSVPAQDLQSALKSGFRLASGEDVAKQKLEDKYGPDGELALLAGLGRGLTATGSDYLLGALGGSAMKERLAAYQDLHPGASMVGEGAGALIGGLLTGGESTAAKILSSPTRLVSTLGGGLGRLAEGTIGEGILSTGLSFAGEGALYNSLLEGSSSYLNDVPIDGERLYSAAASGALYSGIAGAVLGGIRKGMTGRQWGLADDIAHGREDVSMGRQLLDKNISSVKETLGKKGLAPELQHSFEGLIKEVDAIKKADNAISQLEDVYKRLTPDAQDAFNTILNSGADFHRNVLKNIAGSMIENNTIENFTNRILPTVDNVVGILGEEADDVAKSLVSANFTESQASRFKSGLSSLLDKFHNDTIRLTENGYKVIVSPEEALKKAWTLIDHVDELAKNTERSFPELYNKFRAITRDAQFGPTGKEMFGRAARLTEEGDKVARAQVKAREALETHLMNGSGVDAKFDKKFHSWLGGKRGLVALNDGTESGRAYINYINKAKELENFIGKVTKEAGLPEKHLNEIKSANTKLKAIDESLQELKTALTWRRGMTGLEAFGNKLNSQSAMISGAIRSGAMAGGFAGVATGNPLAIPLGALGGGAMSLAYRAMTTPAMYVRYAAGINEFLVKRASKVTTAIEDITKNSVKTVSPVPRKFKMPPPGSSILAIEGLRGKQSQQERMDKIYGKLRTSVGQEDRMRAEMMKKLGANPTLSRSIDESIQVGQRARKYLIGLAWSKAVGINTSRWEAGKFLQAVRGIQHPEQIISRALSGQLSTQEALAYKEVYPNDYNKVRVLLGEKMQDLKGSGKDLPFNTRVKLSLAFNISLDPKMSAQYVSEMMTAQMPGDVQNPQQASRDREVPQIHNLYENKSEVVGDGNP